LGSTFANPDNKNLQLNLFKPNRPPRAAATAENVQPAENVQQAEVARPIVQPVPVAVAPMRNVGDGSSYERAI
jgi:hypothetical protein